MFKHSRLDSLLVAVTCLQVGLLVLPFALELSTPSMLALVVLNIFLMGMNFQCTAHNFIHLPFFKSKKLNEAFSVFNSLGIGVPQSVYKLHHMNHHRFNNQPEIDESSTWRHGKKGKEENIFSYSILGVFRTDLMGLYRQCMRSGKLPRTELIVLLTYFALLALINPKLFFFYLLPCYLGGHIFAMWENYCEHHHADPYDRKRDSVSCYGKLYNLLWFNNGYHQEHHFSPQVHWREISKVRALLPEDRVIVKGCHLTNSW